MSLLQFPKLSSLLTNGTVKTFLETGVRSCSSGLVYESTKITNKLLDANTLYQLDKYSKYYIFSKTNKNDSKFDKLSIQL